MLMRHKNACLILISLLALCSGVAPAQAAGTPVPAAGELVSENEGGFAIGVGVGLVKFDSNAKVTDRQIGSSRYLDLEGNLDLDEVSRITSFYGAFRFSDKHSLLFNYFDISRSANLFDFAADYGDLVLIRADVSVRDESRFYNLNYGYSLLRDGPNEITLVVGLNSLDLKLEAEARGQITVGGASRSEVTVTEASVFAPLPLFGLNFSSGFTPDWSLATKIALITGSYDDVSASVLQTSITSKYQISRNAGLLLGLTYFSADVEIDEQDELTEIAYAYNGLFLGVHFGL
jgi:hypothetical protein